MNIYVGNLPFTITEDKVKDLFVGFGEVTKINLITDRTTGEPRGFGFVEMPIQSEAEAASSAVSSTIERISLTATHRNSYDCLSPNGLTGPHLFQINLPHSLSGEWQNTSLSKALLPLIGAYVYRAD